MSTGPCHPRPFVACLGLALAASMPAAAENTGVARANSGQLRCHILSMMEKDLSEALKKCGGSTVFFRPELFQSQPVNGVIAASRREAEFHTRFGQGRFVQRFPLYPSGLYVSFEAEERDSAPAATRQAALGGTVRGGLIEENADDLGQPTVRGGVATWAALPPVIEPDMRISGVGANLVLNDGKISLSLVLSPAESGNGLTIMVKLSGEAGAEFGVPRIRRTGDRSGEPMDMVGRRAGDGEFTFVPAAESQAVQSIVSALLRGQWIDVPVRLRGERSYILTMELARPGKALLTRALSDWGLLAEAR